MGSAKISCIKSLGHLAIKWNTSRLEKPGLFIIRWYNRNMEQTLLSSFMKKRKQRDKTNDALKKKTLEWIETKEVSTPNSDISPSLPVSPKSELVSNEVEPSPKEVTEKSEPNSVETPTKNSRVSEEISTSLHEAKSMVQRAHVKYRYLISDTLPIPMKYTELWMLYEAVEISAEFCRSRGEHCLYDKIKKSVENISQK